MSIRLDTIRPNLTLVEVGPLTVWFSYQTPIAYRAFDGEVHVCVNVWGQTTGRHINLVAEGPARETVLDFNRGLAAATLAVVPS